MMTVGKENTVEKKLVGKAAEEGLMEEKDLLGQEEEMMASDEVAQEGMRPPKLMLHELDEKGIRDRHRDFEREAMPHINALYNFALRMTGDPDDANDLLQETYMKAYRFWDKFEPGTNCKAWLFRIMKNSYINIYRKESKEPDKVDYEDIQNFYNTIRSEYTDPNDMEARLYRNLLDDDLTRAVESLPEDFRTVVILCDIEGFTYEEIAEFVDCPIGTVRSRLHRGRKLLRNKLIEYARVRGYNVEEERHRKTASSQQMQESEMGSEIGTAEAEPGEETEPF